MLKALVTRALLLSRRASRRIDKGRMMIPAGDNGPAEMTSRAIALVGEFEQSGDLSSLEHAVALFRVAVAATPEGSVHHAGRLGNLGHVLVVLGTRTGESGTLAEAVEVRRATVAAVSDGDPGRAGYSGDLAHALYQLYERNSRG